MRTFLRANGLATFFGTIFVCTLAAQSLAGQRTVSAEQREHGGGSVSWWDYVTSPDFWGAVTENWQSEFLQFTLFVGASVWLVQKGSNESKKLDDVGLETDEQQEVGRHATARSPRFARGDGLVLRLDENSLLLTMGLVFLATWLAQSLNNWRTFDQAQRATATPRCRGGATCSTRTSGRRRSRTGSPSSSPSA